MVFYEQVTRYDYRLYRRGIVWVFGWLCYGRFNMKHNWEIVEWLPIEAMPIGIECLVYHEIRKLIEIKYRPADRTDSLYPGGSDIGWYSHWMPLPEAP